MKRTILVFSLSFISVCYAAGAPEINISLAQAQSWAVKHSPRLKSLEREVDAAKSALLSAESYLYPRAVFEATGKYQSGVPEMTLSLPGANRTVALGDNWNMSAGPSVYYTLFDKGAQSLNSMSRKKQVRAKERAREAEKRSVLLSARMAYFDLMLALEQTVVIADNLRLAQEQYDDIRLKTRTGVLTRRDELRAHQEVIARKLELMQARAGLSQSIRALFALCGKWDLPDTSLALDARLKGNEPKGIEPASVFISADKAEETLKNIKPSGLDIEGNPALLSLVESAQALRTAAKSIASGRWPRAQIALRSSLEYPDGPSPNGYWQNTAAISVSLPLFESGRTENNFREENFMAASVDETRRQQTDDIRRELLKAHDRLASLESQRHLHAQNVKESAEIAQLIYSSYKAGQVTFLEVQNANTKVLQARFQQVNNNIAVLLETSLIASLEGEK